MRFLSRLAASTCLLFASIALAQNYTTNITLANLQSGGAVVGSAEVCATPADKYGNPITISAPTWGLVLPNPPLCGTVANGSLPVGLNVPDASHTNAPASIFYNISIQVLVGGIPVRAPILLTAVPNITGASFALDSYTPVVSVTTPLPNTVGYGPGIPAACTAPSLWMSTNSQAYTCIGGSYVSLSTGPQGVPGPSGSAIVSTTVTVSASTALAGTGSTLVRCNAAAGAFVTVSLPAAPIQGQMVYVKNVGSGSCTIQGAAGTKIDGQSSFSLNSGYLQQALSVVYDSASNTWNVL